MFPPSLEKPNLPPRAHHTCGRTDILSEETPAVGEDRLAHMDGEIGLRPKVDKDRRRQFDHPIWAEI